MRIDTRPWGLLWPVRDYVARLALAIRRPRFQVVMLGWLILLNGFFFFPSPQGFSIDSYIYRNALFRMREGDPAYLVPDTDATAQSFGRPIYYFPPPPAAIVGGAISALPQGQLLWFCFNVAAWGACFVWMRRLVPPIPELRSLAGPGAALVLGIVAWFLWGPALEQLFYGNQQSLVLLCTIAMTHGVLRKQPMVGGLGLAGAVLIKASPALFALTFLVARQWRLLAWAACFGAAGALLSLPIVGIGPWIDFVHALLTGSDLVSGQGYNMSPLAGLLPSLGEIPLVAMAGIGMALAGRLPPREMLIVSIAVFLLAWPVQWLHYAAIALVPLSLLLPDRRVWLALATAFVCFGFIWYRAWLPATLLLIVAALRPEVIDRVQRGLSRALAAASRPHTAEP